MNTPILLLVYNRPEPTLRVLQRLKELGATNVFVSGDGPKNSADRERTKEVKSNIHRFTSIVSNSRFSDRNEGCKKAVIGGINWFFDQVDEGIILEDDCLPSEHFFPFMNDMLIRYREVKKVWMISGNNPLGSWESDGGHFFSRIGHIWGWATWRNRWDDFRPELPYIQSFIDDSGFEKAFGPTKLAENRKQLTLQSKRGEIDTWDYQWMAQILTENGLAVVPSQNLIENIGFTDEGTNLTSKPSWITNEVATTSRQTNLSHQDLPLLIGCSSPFLKGLSRHSLSRFFFGKTGDFSNKDTKKHFKIDREYEMELELCRRSNTSASKSAFHYSELGKTADKKRRIVLINSTDIGGGAEKITLELHQELLSRGHEVFLLVQNKKSNLDSVIELATTALEQIRQLKPDVIHVHNLHGTNVELNELATLSKETSTLFTLHDSWLTTGSTNHPFILDSTTLSFLEMKEWKNELEARKAAISNSTIQFTTPSQWLRERLFDVHGIKADFVPNGIKRTAPSAVDIPSNRYILFVANNAKTNPYKDFKTLKKAWIEVNKHLGDGGIDLVCVSGSAVEEMVGSNKFIMLPKLTNEQVLNLMEHALFVVQASKQDNAPLSILEAHSVRKFVVASLVGGIPELLSETELEFTFEPENPQQLEQRLLEAVHSLTKGVLVHSATNAQSFSQMIDTYLGHYLELTNA